MILDNSNQTSSVYDYLERFVASGELDIVVGYFTIGALVWLCDNYNSKIEKFRFVLGELTNVENNKITRLDLLNQEISIKHAVSLRKTAQKAVKFLQQNNVEIRTTEPNFCHAKLYLQRANEERFNYFISGSSNLTEAGIGKKHTSNIELNIAHYGDIPTYNELKLWFDGLWTNVKLKDNKKELIKEISKIFNAYTPNDIYLKILSEIFTEESLAETVEKELGKTEIYQKLFDFQKAAVVSLVKKMDTSGGAILADAVGLGKTFTALTVIKYYQKKEGRRPLVLAPKKLEYNWKQYLPKVFGENIFQKDDFRYQVMFHTDLNEKRFGEIYNDLINDDPKLIIIDESHNLRNDKSARYVFLINEIIRKNQNIKVLLLSATPINNSILDVFNQIKLLGDYDQKKSIFTAVDQTLLEWSLQETRNNISSLKNSFHHDFTDLMDSLIVARTRKEVASKEINFPKLNTPINIRIAPNCIDNIETFEALLDLLPANFSVYMPAVYAGHTNKNVYHDESRRSGFLVRMMQIMIAKRLESSWVSFKKTIENILQYHISVLFKIQNFQDLDEEGLEALFEEEDQENIDEYRIGKKNPINICEIKNLEAFAKDVKIDLSKLEYIKEQLENFEPKNDEKLKKLISIIKNKQKNENKKVLIFTTYRDTAEYLFEQLSLEFTNIEIVSGASSAVINILKRFSPIANNANETQRNNPIDILVSTDVLSVGQNLQDCDCVINYDIHWNPVSIIQRVGRIDRIGSTNKEIYCYNFWPSENIEDYLNLKGRVETRMATMTIGKSEIINNLTDELEAMTKDNEFEKRQEKINLKMMENSLEDIKNGFFGYNDLSLESFKQDLTKASFHRYKDLPKGIFSGFKSDEIGLVALLENKLTKAKKLIYIKLNGDEIKQNQHDILSFLSENREATTYVPDLIESGDPDELQKYADAIFYWIDKSIQPEKDKLVNDVMSGSLSLSKVNQNTEIEKQYQKNNWDLICWEVVS
ncbi:MAG: SNF2-related protein [Candidatus Cloacimonetes bacterium]|nr:SNF2-related protein [Candidatus Cloacimonadota bacterium]